MLYEEFKLVTFNIKIPLIITKSKNIKYVVARTAIN